MPRRADLDRGGAPVPVGKNPEMLDEADKRSRDDTRGGLRELDKMVENRGGLSRHVKDENRALPRDGTGNVRSRRLPADGEPRRITAYRQRILNTQKTAFGREKVPVRVSRAFAAVFGSDSRELARINDLLADNVGDVEALDEDTARKVRRVDRALRMGEAHNNADNIVYTPDPATTWSQLRKRDQLAEPELRRRHRGQLRPLYRVLAQRLRGRRRWRRRRPMVAVV